MPPRLILLIGVLFVYYAFKTANKRGVSPPPQLFWPSLWYMVVSSRAVGIWLSIWGVPLPGGGSAEDGSPIDALFFLALTIIGLVILHRRRFSWGETLRANSWVAALFFFMALSVLWSKYPFVSFKRYIKVLGSVSMALVVVTNEQPLESILTVLRRCLYVHLPMDIICVKYFRDIGVSFDWSGSASAWQGISTSKNSLGQVAMLGVLYFYWEVRRRWPELRWKNLNLVYLLMSIYLLKGSEDAISVTSVSVCIFTMLVFMRLQTLRLRIATARRFVLAIFTFTMSFILLIVVHSIVMFSEDSLFGLLITKFGRDITLTDRTYIWHDVYAAAAGHGLLGVGFGGFWIGREANIPWDEKMSWVLGQAHNGYIDTYLQIGIVGSVLMCGLIFATIGRLLESLNTDFDLACFRISLFLAILYINATESTYLRGDHHLWFVMQLIIWIVPTGAAPLFTGGREEAEPMEPRMAEAVYR
jgi:exopolysaccharide production protein ExoQ